MTLEPTFPPHRTHSFQADFAAFSTLDARYRPLRLLNEGGMATLCLAEDLQASDPNHHQVAIKVLRPHLCQDIQALTMFRDEIRLLEHLSHPAIVNRLAAQEHGPHPYLVLEYVEGCDLKTFLHLGSIQDSAPLPWLFGYQIALGILQGLAYLHQAVTDQGRPLHVVHRDLSPSNVLLSIHGEIKLTDFGSSLYQQMFRDTLGEEWRGKFAYLSPELLSGQPANSQTDIFSWGVMVWELFAEQSLFSGHNPEAVLQQIKTLAIPYLQRVRPDVPAELCDLVSRTLERDPNQRIANTQDLLQSWLAFTQQPVGQKALCSLSPTLAQKIAQRVDQSR